MAGLAYLLLPVTGLIAYFASSSARTRFHGLQAIVIGALWPLALYAGSVVSPRVTQAVFGVGILVWLTFLVGALIGRDPKLPGVGKSLRDLARASLEEDVRGAR